MGSVTKKESCMICWLKLKENAQNNLLVDEVVSVLWMDMIKPLVQNSAHVRSNEADAVFLDEKRYLCC